MIATTTEYAEIARRMTEGEVLHLTDISWEDYEELLTELEGQRNVRLTYDGGRLQIMVVSSKHESYSRRIYDLITVLADETGQDAEGFGSMTLRKRRKAKGTEPDECFYVQNAARVIGREDLSRLYPFTRHNTRRPLSALAMSAGLLQHPCSNPTLKNGNCSTSNALQSQSRLQRSAAVFRTRRRCVPA
jgi:hypothetical protein